MTIVKGMTLGPYEILAHIGEGGMGEVWRARDQRIGREVAVKVLPDGFLEDEHLWRFEQEARAAGALNHPGLVTIFDVGRTNGSPYIVMELLEGETLRDTIGDATPAPLQARKAVQYAIQIATALAVTHEKGIIHRDLKPENIFVTSDGRVKILDFGLAKLAREATGSNGAHNTAKYITSAGIAVGTPAYMSPEQVRAHPIDHRTDIFSFGAVLYEMLTGRPAFDGASAIETMHAVLNTEPPALTDVDPRIPPALEAVVAHCLEKNPRDRFQSAHDLAFQLRMLPDPARITNVTRSIAPFGKRSRYRIAAIVLPIVLAAVAGGFFLRGLRGGAPQAIVRTYKQLTFAGGVESLPALAPDGKSFAYVSAEAGNRDIYLQRVDGRMALNLTKDSPEDDSEPAFSPDGSQIAFHSERNGGGIYVMGATGESAHRLTDAGHNPSWSPDGARLVVSTQDIELRPHLRPVAGELWIIDVKTEARRPLFQNEENRGTRDIDGVQPSWSPHGKRVAFWGVSPYPGGNRHIWTIDPDAKQPLQTLVQVTADVAFHWNPVWSPDGRHLYFGSDRDGTMNLWRIPMNEETGRATGPPEQLSLPTYFSGNFTFSQLGEMAYTSVSREYRLLAFPFDPGTAKAGEPRPLFSGTQEILYCEPSPDQRSVAYTTGGRQEDLFVTNVETGRLTQLTNDGARDRAVAWSPDGKALYVYSNRDGPYHIWRIHADGSGLARLTSDADLKPIGATSIMLPNAAPDGRTLAAQTDNANVFIHLDRPAGKRLEHFADQPRLLAPKWSPDGKHLAGDVGARGFAVYTLATRRLEKILDRGSSPQWLPGGNRIVFFDHHSIGIFDLDTRRITEAGFTSPAGVDLSDKAVTPRLSRDGSTLYARQILEQGDVWMVRFPKE